MSRFHGHFVSSPRPAPTAANATPAPRRFARRLLAGLLATSASIASLAAAPPVPVTPEAPRPPDCADRPLPPPIRELALPADQLARVVAALRAGCEREQQVHEDNRRALAALLSPEQMHRVEGRLRPPPPPGAAAAPCRPEGDGGPTGRRP